MKRLLESIITNDRITLRIQMGYSGDTVLNVQHSSHHADDHVAVDLRHHGSIARNMQMRFTEQGFYFEGELVTPEILRAAMELYRENTDH